METIDFMPPTIHQKKVQYRAIEFLMAHGSITAWDIQQLRSTDARKIITRLRRMGLIKCSEWESRISGMCYMRHYWSGVAPTMKTKGK